MGGKDQAGTSSDTAQPRDQQLAAAAQPQQHYQTLADVDTPTMRTLWQHIASYLDDGSLITASLTCKVFAKDFRAAVTSLDISEQLEQEDFERIAAAFPNVEDLSIHCEYDDNQPMLDFSAVRLPNLRQLTLDCCPITTLSFTTANTPLLESLSIENQGCNAMHGFHLELPELRTLSLNYVEVHDPRGFGPSLSACPKLESMSCYKVWGLGGMVHDLDLPCCESLDLYRSDDFEGMRLRAPQLQELNLRACYGLECVRILDDDQPPAAGSAAAAAATGAGGVAAGPAAAEDADGDEEEDGIVPLVVNLVNANIDKDSKRHLKQHPRVRAGTLITKESDEYGGGMGFGGFGGGMFGGPGADGDEDTEDEDEDDDDMMPNNVAAMMAMFAQLAQEQMPQGFGMPPGFGGGHGVHIEDEDEDEFEDEGDSEWETDEDA